MSSCEIFDKRRSFRKESCLSSSLKCFLSCCPTTGSHRRDNCKPFSGILNRLFLKSEIRSAFCSRLPLFVNLAISCMDLNQKFICSV